jgi:LemA protein
MILILSAVFLVIVVILITIFILIYNKFQRLHNGAEAGLSQIKVALKKRLDLITQLADVVKAYSKFEKSVMQNITRMRSLIGKDIKADEVDNINSSSSGILKSILAVVENYPDLKASKNYLDLMSSLKEVESEILRQRYTYNNIVQEYNTRLGVVPSNFVAKLFSYSKLEYLKFEDDLKKSFELEMK